MTSGFDCTYRVSSERCASFKYCLTKLNRLALLRKHSKETIGSQFEGLCEDLDEGEEIRGLQGGEEDSSTQRVVGRDILAGQDCWSDKSSNHREAGEAIARCHGWISESRVESDWKDSGEDVWVSKVDTEGWAKIDPERVE